MKRFSQLVGVYVLAALCGVGALVAVAAVTATPAVFLAAGLVTFVGMGAGLIWLVTRRWPHPTRTRRRAVLAGTTAGVALFTFTVLIPPGDPALPPEPVPGQSFVRLTTGSRIAYARRPAAPSTRGDTRGEPIIFVHGGPGVPDLAGDMAYFGQLAEDGHDVYVYAQVGSGASSRLDDPMAYTLDRHVADLEAFRRYIHAEKVTLIGHSFGGVLAAAYVADHPNRVVKAVYSSPGDLDPTAGGASMVSRLTVAQQMGLYARLLRPRDLLAYTLVQVNPRAAHALTGDADMDARFDGHYNKTRPGLRCDGRYGPELHGLGAYANLVPQSASRPILRDRRPAFAHAGVPGLVIKGSCDYVSWSSTLDYLNPHTRLVYLHGAGHNAYQERPKPFLALVRAFLADDPLPTATYPGRQRPADFEGPA
ncbi:MAG TPA: alpha/beta hydrolase [Actinopolymorphaceae bacterium]|jgi:proline iminopeptidase